MSFALLAILEADTRAFHRRPSRQNAAGQSPARSARRSALGSFARAPASRFARKWAMPRIIEANYYSDTRVRLAGYLRRCYRAAKHKFRK